MILRSLDIPLISAFTFVNSVLIKRSLGETLLSQSLEICGMQFSCDFISSLFEGNGSLGG